MRRNPWLPSPHRPRTGTASPEIFISQNVVGPCIPYAKTNQIMNDKSPMHLFGAISTRTFQSRHSTLCVIPCSPLDQITRYLATVGSMCVPANSLGHHRLEARLVKLVRLVLYRPVRHRRPLADGDVLAWDLASDNL